MNKKYYRVVFNKVRGLWMVVAENWVCRGKGGRQAHAIREVDAWQPLQPFMLRLISSSIWLAFGWTVCPSTSQAQIVADANAPGNLRPTVLAAPNGVSLVNIQTPSGAGVSRNVYGQFDVEQRGAVLNNSRTNAQTQLGGWIQGNPWLAAGTARVILNEVRAGNPSLLRGYVEVAGSRAQVVIANPAGVTCDGCGFINANRATLSTGTPVMNGGNLDGYRVQGGVIAIAGAGLDASTTDYTDLIARAVHVNAGIWANQLKLTAGANQVDAGNTMAAPIAGTGAAPALAVDVAQLGGMYAGKITLVGTETGVGVRNAGHIGASAGEVVVTADGRLENLGRITSSCHTQIAASADIDNSGTVYAQGNVRLSTRGNIDNSGTIAARGNATLMATGANGRITSTSGSLFGAGVQTDGSLAGNGVLSISTTQTLTARGQNLSGGDQILAAQAIDLSGSRTNASNLDLRALRGDINLGAATVNANQTLTVETGQTLRIDRARLSAAHIGISAQDLSNLKGEIVQFGSGDLTLNLSGKLDNTRGQITAAEGLNVSTAQTLRNVEGVLAANHQVHISANRIDNTQGVIASVQAGTHVTANAGVVDNAVGRIDAAQAVKVSAAGVNNVDGVVRGSSLTINSHTQGVNNVRGKIIATGASGDGTLDLQGGMLNNDGGTLQAVGDVDIRLAGTLDNTSGLMRSDRTLSLIADRVINVDTQASDRGLEGRVIGLNASHIDNRRGAMRADDALTVTGTGYLDNTQGLISAGGFVALQDANTVGKTLVVSNTGGTLIAGQRLGIDSADLGGDGKLLSQGDLAIRLTQDYWHTGELHASGSASVETAGTLTNRSTLVSGAALNLKAAAIDNLADGTVRGEQLELETTDGHSLNNRGLIDGQDVFIETTSLNNLGSGRIYGDRVAITATAVTNDAENGTAAVIAARDRLDIGADTITNREHALLFSAGDLAIGGHLDDMGHAAGQANTLSNASATIEALGDMAISVRQINNTNEHFSTELVSLGSIPVVEYQHEGGINRYQQNEVTFFSHGDGITAILTPETWGLNVDFPGERFYKYVFDRSTQQSQVLHSDPARILAAGTLSVSADTVLNDKSQILAGGSLGGAIGTLNNADASGQRIVTDTGSVAFHYREKRSGSDDEVWAWSAYEPAPTVQSIALSPAVYQQFATSAGSGTQLAAYGDGGTSAAIGTISVPQAVVRADGSSAGNQAPLSFVRSVTPDARLPAGSLFRIDPKPGARYLVETDPRFADYRNWLSSDYLLAALRLDPAITQKRLGDGFYEQSLIREQVAQLTGRRFLEGYASDEAQYRDLMNAGATYAEAWNLIPGVALTQAQMAQLTGDIVWLVQETVTLADGSTTQVLVPQVFVRVREGDLSPSGALIAADSVDLDVARDLANSGTIAGERFLSIAAENIRNLGGTMAGDEILARARTDLDNLGGTLTAKHSLTALAGRDFNVISTSRAESNAQASRIHVDRIAGLYVTGASGTLLASAGRDANLIAAALKNEAAPAVDQAAGSTSILAGRDLKLGTLQANASQYLVWDGDNRRRDASNTDIGTLIETWGDIRLQADRDLNAKAASVTSEQGALLVVAGHDLNLTTGEARVQRDEAHRHKNEGFLSSTIVTTRNTLDQTQALGTSLSADTVTVLAGQDIAVKGSNVVASRDVAFAAGRDIAVEAATNTTAESHFKDELKSGLFTSGGLGITLGTQEQSTDQQGTTTAATASTIGSIEGSISMRAGGSYRQLGSHIMAPAGDVDITARSVDITEAREVGRSETETQFKQTGLTLAITGPVISAIETAWHMSQAAQDTRDGRMKLLAGANAALAGKSAYDAVQKGQGTTIAGKANQMPVTNDKGEVTGSRDASAAEQAGGINLSISIGTSSSKSNSVSSSDRARGSSISAGGGVGIRAAGAGAESDLLIRGSTVSAGDELVLAADDKIELLAARNAAEQHSTNSSSSGSIGISIGTSGIGVTLSASQGRGKADGTDESWTNTRIEGNRVGMASGNDMVLRGAVVRGRQVSAEVGGNLLVESLQDRSTYASKQQSIGGSLTVGAGVSGSFSASSSKASSSYASVTEQSGIKAGDGGFQVRVAGNTDLKGAVLASTHQAAKDGKNRLTTATLTASDIENHAEASASSIGIGFSSDMLSQGKYGAAKALVGSALSNSRESDSSDGITRSAVQGARVTITDESAQLALTGKTAATTVAQLNRDTTSSQSVAERPDAGARQQSVDAEREIKQEAVRIVTTLTDETYRSRFQEKQEFLKLDCPAGTTCIADPSSVQRTLTALGDVAANTSPDMVLAVNGILNDEKRATELAYQNTELIKADANGQPLAEPVKPTSVYLMHIKPANNTISELIGVAYEKLINSMSYGVANFLGYTNAAETYAQALSSREDKATQSLGHSRGTLVQESAFTILANRPDENGTAYTNSNLKVRGVGGAADVQSYTDKAAKVINDPRKTDNITYSYFSNDPVSTFTLSGGNPGAWVPEDLWQVFSTDNSMHSCYGTGGKGCRQVEIPVSGGPQGTPGGNAKLVRYKGGQQVDQDGIPRTETR